MDALLELLQQVEHLTDVSPRSVSPDQAHALDAFCEAVVAAHSGAHPVDAAVLKSGLAAVLEVDQGPPRSAEAPTSSWQAGVVPVPGGAGRMLILEDGGAGAQELRFYLDASNVLYTGFWTALPSEADAPSLTFSVQEGPSGWELRVGDGVQELQVALGSDLPGFAWTSEPVFAQQPSGEARPSSPWQDLMAVLASEFAESEEILTSETTEEAQPVFCPQCGKENPPENSFCGACGSRL